MYEEGSSSKVMSPAVSQKVAGLSLPRDKCNLDIFCEVPNKKPAKFEYVQNSRRKALRRLYKV